MAQPTNGKIYITISDERKGVSPDSPRPDEPENEKENELSSYILHKTWDILRQNIQKATQITIQEIGNLTGDYAAQREIEMTYNTISKITGDIISGAITYAKYGAPGLIIAGAALITSSTIDSIFSFIKNNREFNKQQYQLEQLRLRSGLNAYLDGSRGTEN